MTAQFPTVVPVYTNPTASMTLGSADHVAQHSNINDDVIGLATKLGKGASLPNTAGVLRVTNTGTQSTGYGLIQTADFGSGVVDSAAIANGAIVDADVNASAAVALSKLASTGSANRVVATSTGAAGSFSMQQVASAMIAADAVSQNIAMVTTTPQSYANNTTPAAIPTLSVSITPQFSTLIYIFFQINGLSCTVASPNNNGIITLNGVSSGVYAWYNDLAAGVKVSTGGFIRTAFGVGSALTIAITWACPNGASTMNVTQASLGCFEMKR
jgi:hypothetical protein